MCLYFSLSLIPVLININIGATDHRYTFAALIRQLKENKYIKVLYALGVSNYPGI